MARLSKPFLRIAGGAMLISLVILLTASGCRTYRMPDPNNPGDSGRIRPDVLSRNVETYQNRLRAKIESGEINDEERRNLISEYIETHTEGITPEDVDPEFAWHFGEVYREIENWEQSYAFFKIAAENAQTEDRRVNDSLKLALAAAMLERPEEAISVARSVFDCPPTDKAPILPAVLYEIAPAATDQGVNTEVTELLVEAVEQHLQVVVDPESAGGAAFLLAKPHHISLAYAAAMQLYQVAGNTERARELVQERDEVLSRFGNA